MHRSNTLHIPWTLFRTNSGHVVTPMYDHISISLTVNGPEVDLAYNRNEYQESSWG
jgi:hypothetical protein